MSKSRIDALLLAWLAFANPPLKSHAINEVWIDELDKVIDDDGFVNPRIREPKQKAQWKREVNRGRK